MINFKWFVGLFFMALSQTVLAQNYCEKYNDATDKFHNIPNCAYKEINGSVGILGSETLFTYRHKSIKDVYDIVSKHGGNEQMLEVVMPATSVTKEFFSVDISKLNDPMTKNSIESASKPFNLEYRWSGNKVLEIFYPAEDGDVYYRFQQKNNQTELTVIIKSTH